MSLLPSEKLFPPKRRSPLLLPTAMLPQGTPPLGGMPGIMYGGPSGYNPTQGLSCCGPIDPSGQATAKPPSTFPLEFITRPPDRPLTNLLPHFINPYFH